MGNQPSKNKDKSDAASISSKSSRDPGFDSYPSFSKSETKESSRSIRTSLKNKLPIGSSKDSPRASAAALAETDRSDAASTKSGRSNSRSHRASTGSATAVRPNAIDMPSNDSAVVDGDEDSPPPSPSQSKRLGLGHDMQKMKEAEQTGEVDHVSDAPPSKGAAAAQAQKDDKPKESILIKRDHPIPVSTEELDRVANEKANGAPISQSVGGVEPDMGALKPIDLDDMITRLLDAAYNGKVQKSPPLRNAEITALCAAARQVFLTQPSLLELSAPVKIVGDIHGQFTDLIRMFEMCGFPPNSNFLFLGDYVDRGKQSLETILLLLAYKIKYPENFFLLRGNHECANVTRVYGFYDECKRRCNIKIWKGFIDVFNTLPIAAIVAGKIFCVHGGLSPSLSHMDDIRNIARPTDVPDYGLLNDLLWSDPADLTETDWEANERGVSYCFGKKVILDFLQRHDFDLVCRAHMVVEDGYEFFGDRVLVTVFSAPNYCNEFDNWGAVMSVSSELLCSFELLKPLDITQLKSHIKKARNERRKGLTAAGKQVVNSPPASQYPQSY